jgi:hypothetical protein
MPEKREGSRTVAILSLITALLAWSAAIVGYLRGHHIKWSILAAGLFFAVLGLRTWPRGRASSQGSK